jgi:thiol-disulfide isomerase/thioredoxin
LIRDTSFLTRVSLAGTAPLEQGLVDKFRPATPQQPPTAGGPVAMTGKPPKTPQGQAAAQAADLPVEGRLPSLSGAVAWVNSPPLTPQELKGKVVVVDFWTYSCINCLRAIPYVRAWAEKYKDEGLVVIGVHTPEFAFEKNIDNVKKAVADLRIRFPVAIDNNYAIWQAFSNNYWPADYFIDAQGRRRDHAFGEGDYAASEHVIQQLLAEAGRTKVAGGVVAVHAAGAQAASDEGDVQSPETSIGYGRAENFASPGGAVKDASHLYAAAQAQAPAHPTSCSSRPQRQRSPTPLWRSTSIIRACSSSSPCRKLG